MEKDGLKTREENRLIPYQNGKFWVGRKGSQEYLVMEDLPFGHISIQRLAMGSTSEKMLAAAIRVVDCLARVETEERSIYFCIRASGCAAGETIELNEEE